MKLDYSYNKTYWMHQCIKFIVFWNDALHISDGLSVHHKEFKTVHTATGMCQTGTGLCKQKFHEERFNLRKLNELEVRKQYQMEITNRFGRILKRMSKPQLKRV